MCVWVCSFVTSCVYFSTSYLGLLFRWGPLFSFESLVLLFCSFVSVVLILFYNFLFIGLTLGILYNFYYWISYPNYFSGSTSPFPVFLILLNSIYITLFLFCLCFWYYDIFVVFRGVYFLLIFGSWKIYKSSRTK